MGTQFLSTNSSKIDVRFFLNLYHLFATKKLLQQIFIIHQQHARNEINNFSYRINFQCFSVQQDELIQLTYQSKLMERLIEDFSNFGDQSFFKGNISGKAWQQIDAEVLAKVMQVQYSGSKKEEKPFRLSHIKKNQKLLININYKKEALNRVNSEEQTNPPQSIRIIGKNLEITEVMKRHSQKSSYTRNKCFSMGDKISKFQCNQKKEMSENKIKQSRFTKQLVKSNHIRLSAIDINGSNKNQIRKPILTSLDNNPHLDQTKKPKKQYLRYLRKNQSDERLMPLNQAQTKQSRKQQMQYLKIQRFEPQFRKQIKYL